MRRRLLTVGAPVWLLVALTLPAVAQGPTGTLKKIKDSGTLTIGFRENALPFSFLGPNGTPAGYSIDLCNQIAQAVGQELGLSSLKVQYVPVTPDNRIEAVASGAVDIECGTTTASLARQEKVDFTLLTFIDGASLLIAEGAGITSPADLAGKRIALVPDTTTARALAAYLQSKGVTATVVPVKDHDEGLAALQAATADAYASDRVILIGLALRAQGTIRLGLVEETLSYEPYAFMVRRDDAPFRLIANRTLARLYRSGAIGAIYAKWFGALGKPSGALVLMYAIEGLPE